MTVLTGGLLWDVDVAAEGESAQVAEIAWDIEIDTSASEEASFGDSGAGNSGTQAGGID